MSSFSNGYFVEGAWVQQVFGLFKCPFPHPLLSIPSTECGLEQEALCLYSGSHKVWAAERAQARISKGARRALLPTGQHWEEN